MGITESHVWYIIPEPTVDFREVHWVAKCCQVSAEFILLLIVGKDRLHGFGSGPATFFGHNFINIAVHVEDWGVFIDRGRQANWWLRAQQWKPSDHGKEAAKFVPGVQGSVEGEGPAL